MCVLIMMLITPFQGLMFMKIERRETLVFSRLGLNRPKEFLGLTNLSIFL
jgi:hypothetical protein